MELFLNILFLIIGLVLLIKGADAFVDGASSIAKLLKIPSLIVGLTIVALGTSLPELAVSVVAAINNNINPGMGYVDMSVGNVVGSNLFNTLVVLGVTAVLVPVAIEKKTLKFEIPVVLGVSVLLLIAATTGSKTVTWYYGLIFLVLLVGYIWFLIYRTKKEAHEEKDDEPKMPVWKAIIFLVLGAAAIAFGGECVNSTAVVIASYCGMDQKLIALTIVALGTSLPELVTSVVAVRKGENDIALGNVLGSNILNILFILGTASLVTPLPISSEMVVDLFVLVGITIVLIVMAILTMKKQGINRVCGIILLCLYAIYLTYIICRNYGALPDWMVI